MNLLKKQGGMIVNNSGNNNSNSSNDNNSNNNVALIIDADDDMKKHSPHNVLHCCEPNMNIFELPQRILSIEACLKGFDGKAIANSYELPPGSNMQFIPMPTTTKNKKFIGYGSMRNNNLKQIGSNNALAAKPNSLWSKCKIIPSPLVTSNDVARVHNKKYLLHFTNQCKHAIDKVYFPLYNPSETSPSIDDDDINEDIYYSAGTERAVKRAAGGAVQSVRELFVIDKKTGRAISRSSTSSSCSSSSSRWLDSSEPSL